MKRELVLFLFSLGFCFGLFTFRYPKLAVGDFPEQWYTQVLDHFGGSNQKTFQQRYYVNDLYYSGKSDSPIFLYINGEGPVSGPPHLDTDEVVILAKKFGGYIVTLEHRYYGKSVPFTSLETPNLKWLNTRQALGDLSRFITDFKKMKNMQSHKVFTIGGSYSGALSAWFRIKFSNVTVGSISSSGVVNAILDFTAFDQQVATSAGEECAHVLRRTTREIERLVLESGPQKAKETKEKFHAGMLTVDGDFFYLMADIMAESVQYDQQDQLCIPMVKAFKEHGDKGLVDAFSNYTVNYWYQNFGSAEEYGTAFQQNTTVVEANADRQWWYQKCSELAYFQNAPKEGSIRSHMVNMTYHREHCRAVFGEPLWPDTAATNAYYGGAHPTGTKIFFANGSQDPWKHASVTQSISTLEPARVIICHNCGHCVDLRGCVGGCIPSADPLIHGRSFIASHVVDWLK